MKTPTSQELDDFIKSHNLVIQEIDSPIGAIQSLVSGSINHACPYESMMLNNVLWYDNGVGE